MKKILFTAALLAAFPLASTAQVEKQVEVTKAYVPSVESAAKLAVVPDMTDTVKMRPEIDYTITPLSLQTTLSTRPIKPASVTYWTFNRPQTFYVKAGAGYPLNSVLDFYASTQNPGTGYLLGYINHEGRFADIANEYGIKNNSTRMFNRVGVAAGKYLGKRVLEGEIAYDNRMYHRYGSYYNPEQEFEPLLNHAPAGALVDYGDVDVAFRFGDDFKDLSRLNFEVAVNGNFFMDHSKAFGYNDHARQITFGGHAKVGKAFGRHRFTVDAGYEHLQGSKILDWYKEGIFRAGIRYGIDGGFLRLEVGADYYHDRIDSIGTDNYIIPYANFNFNLGTQGLKPFIQIDGGVYDNSFRSLTQLNPYVAIPALRERDPMGYLPGKSRAEYNGRLGVAGSLWRDKFNYRLYAGFSVRDHYLYWTNVREKSGGTPEWELYNLGAFIPVSGRQTVTSFNGEVEYRPLEQLKVSLGVHGYLYNDDTKLENGLPAIEANLGIRYDGRKIAFGVDAQMQGKRSWTTLLRTVGEVDAELTSFEAPGAVDLRAFFDWKISRRVTLFVEGRNLVNSRLYEYAWYREYGANCTVGIKANF